MAWQNKPLNEFHTEGKYGAVVIATTDTAVNVLLEGLDFISGNIWGTQTPDQVLKDVGIYEEPFADLVPEELLTYGILFRGPQDDGRPGSDLLKYQIGVEKGFLEPGYTVSGVATNPPDWPPPPSAEPADSDAPPSPSAIAIIDESVLLEERRYKSFAHFADETETLRLNLIEQQRNHEDLPDLQYVYADTNQPLNFEYFAASITQARDKIKAFLIANDFSDTDLREKPIAIGWRPDPTDTNYIAKTGFHPEEATPFITAKLADAGGNYLAYIRKAFEDEPKPERPGLSPLHVDPTHNWGLLLKGTPTLSPGTVELFGDETGSGLLRRMGGILSQPGADAKSVLARLCSSPLDRVTTAIPGLDPGTAKKRVSLQAFIAVNIQPEPRARPRIPDTPEQMAKEFEKEAKADPKPMTWAQRRTQIIKYTDKGFKYAISTRNLTVEEQVGDALFQILLSARRGNPPLVTQIKNLEDLWVYVLNRVDIQIVALKLMECLGLKLSLNEILDALCDEFLQGIDKALDIDIEDILESLRTEAITLEFMGVSGRSAPILVSYSEIVGNITEAYTQTLAEGIDDPFYQAVIRGTANQPLSKRWVCEIILVTVGAGIAWLIKKLSEEPDPDAKDPIPVIKKCDPTFSIPINIAIPTDLLGHIIRQLKKELEKLVMKKVFEPINNVLLAFASCDDPDPTYGELLLEDLLPDDNREQLADKFKGTGIEDPEGFLSSLLATLTKQEVCDLFNGIASEAVLLHVKTFMQREYPNFYQLFSSNHKILSFFSNLGSILDLSECLIDRPSENLQQLEDLCLDGETLRDTALRRSLAALGLSEEEIQEQLDLQKELLREQVGEVAAAIALTTGGPSDLFEAPEDKDFINNLVAESESLRRQTRYAIDALLDPIGSAFHISLASFIPVLFEEIRKIRDLGINIETLPFRDILKLSELYYETSPGQHSYSMWSPILVFTPGTLDTNPNSFTFGKIIPGTGNIIWQPDNYSNISYALNPPTDSEKVDCFDFSAIAPAAASTMINFVLGDKRMLPPEGLGEFADFLLKTDPDGVADDLINNDPADQKTGEGNPFQYRLFKILLAWALTRGGNYKTKPDQLVSPTGYGAPPQSVDGNLLDYYSTLPGNESPPTDSDLENAKDTIFSGLTDNELDPFIAHILEIQSGESRSFAGILFDKINERLNEQVGEIIASSEYFDFQKIREINMMGDKADKLLDVEGLKNDAVNRAQELLFATDMKSGEKPTHIGDAAFEAAIKAFIKLFIVEFVLSAIFVFSKFRVEDVFADNIVKEYVKRRVFSSVVSLPDGTLVKIREEYENYIQRRVAQLRKKLIREQPSGQELSEEKIVESVKKEIFNGKDTWEELFNDLISEAIDTEQQVFREAMEEFLDMALSILEDEVLQEEIEGDIEEVGPPQGPFTITARNAEIEWRGDVSTGGEAYLETAEETWKNTKKYYVYEGGLDLAAISADGIIDASELADFSEAISSDTFEDWEGGESGADYLYEAPTGEDLGTTAWKLQVPLEATSTCLREHVFSSLVPEDQDAADDSLFPVEIPAGVTLPPGTNWDPGEVLWYPLQPEVVENLAIVDLEGWEIEVEFDDDKCRASITEHWNDGNIYDPDTTPAQLKILKEDLLTKWGAGEGIGFVEYILGYRKSWEMLDEATMAPVTHYISGEELAKHHYTVNTDADGVPISATFKAISSLNRPGPGWPVLPGPDPSLRYNGLYFLGNTDKVLSNAALWVHEQLPWLFGTTTAFLDDIYGPGTGVQATAGSTGIYPPKHVIDTLFAGDLQFGYPWGLEFQALVESGDEKLLGPAGNRYSVTKDWVNVPTKIIVTGVDQSAENYDFSPDEVGRIPTFRYEIERKEVLVWRRVRDKTPINRKEHALPVQEALDPFGTRPEAHGHIWGGSMGPIDANDWNSIMEDAPGDANPWPLIQIRPPVFWYDAWKAGHGWPTAQEEFFETDIGGANEVWVPNVKNIKLTVNGTNFVKGTKAYLMSFSDPNNADFYYFDTEHVNEGQLELTMPIKVAWGKQAGMEGNLDFNFNDGSFKASGDINGQTGQIVEMGGKSSLSPSIFVLVFENPGFKRAVAPVYFHTFNKWNFVWNQYWSTIGYPATRYPEEWEEQGLPMDGQYPNEEPTIPPFPLSFVETAETTIEQAYALPIYNNKFHGWDIFDVPDFWGVELEQRKFTPSTSPTAIAPGGDPIPGGPPPPIPGEEAAPAPEAKQGTRTTFWAKPRIRNNPDTPEFKEKYKNGNIIFEKYVRLRFKPEPDFHSNMAPPDIDPDALHQLKVSLYDSVPLAWNFYTHNAGDNTETNAGLFINFEKGNEASTQIGLDVNSQVVTGEGALVKPYSFNLGPPWTEIPGFPTPLPTRRSNDILLSYSAFQRLLKELIGYSNINLDSTTIGGVFDIETTAISEDDLKETVINNFLTMTDGLNESDFVFKWEPSDIYTGPGIASMMSSPLKKHLKEDPPDIPSYAAGDDPKWKVKFCVFPKHETGAGPPPSLCSTTAIENYDKSVFLDAVYGTSYKAAVLEGWDHADITMAGNIVERTVELESEAVFSDKPAFADLYKLLNKYGWDQVLEDFAYGLRASFVFPKHMYSGYGGTQEQLTSWYTLNYQDTALAFKNALHPYSALFEPEEGNEFFFTMADTFNGQVSSIINNAYKHQSQDIFFSHKINHYKEAEDGVEVEDIYLLPLASVEIGPADKEMPGPLVEGTFTDIRAGFPVVSYNGDIPLGQEIFNRLYKKLRRDGRFKLLFEHIFPIKRFLGFNAIYNNMNFNQFFTDPCTFASVFKSSKDFLGHLINLTSKHPSGDVDIGEPHMSDAGAQLESLATDVYPDINMCPPNLVALGNFLNPQSAAPPITEEEGTE